jgi:hypothetical protein
MLIRALDESIAPAVWLPLVTKQPVFKPKAKERIEGALGFQLAGFTSRTLPTSGVVRDAGDEVHGSSLVTKADKHPHSP